MPEMFKMSAVEFYSEVDWRASFHLTTTEPVIAQQVGKCGVFTVVVASAGVECPSGSSRWRLNIKWTEAAPPDAINHSHFTLYVDEGLYILITDLNNATKSFIIPLKTQ